MVVTEALKRYVETLAKFREYWQFVAFSAVCDSPENTDPLLAFAASDLRHALEHLSDDEVEHLDTNTDALNAFFAPWFNDVIALPTITSNNQLSSFSQEELPFWLSNGIGGRKLAQIRAFLGQIPVVSGTAIEWCAGKGHLGRLLAFTRAQPVVSVEWQAPLCHAGQALAENLQLHQRFVHANVMTDAQRLAPEFTEASQAFALHACGDLHHALIAQAAAAHCEQIYIAPCCYHLTKQVPYQGLSNAAQQQLQQQHLSFSAHDLKLAVQAQVTAGERIAKLRKTEVHWRLAYQCWRESLTSDSYYKPLSSVNKKWFAGGFADFAQWAAQQHQLELPAQCDWPRYLAEGHQRMQRVARLELLRHVFRRPLECLLVLDRAAWLEELGYNVTVAEFCDYQQTPRNFLLKAQRC
ncbi:methyltransferase [Pseudidiomarina woesei]|uniref:Methyltransferase domain n=1 Tax=Pseudidiomarina woesei TaxID=1381080 RepID=A0A0K6H1X0_9GAMM|nr:methyltransferase [Pseudidiomarina woesei]CUA84885.1 Methyltransferase domain [Pseudidiomarina woesei]